MNLEEIIATIQEIAEKMSGMVRGSKHKNFLGTLILACKRRRVMRIIRIIDNALAWSESRKRFSIAKKLKPYIDGLEYLKGHLEHYFGTLFEAMKESLQRVYITMAASRISRLPMTINVKGATQTIRAKDQNLEKFFAVMEANMDYLVRKLMHGLQLKDEKQFLEHFNTFESDLEAIFTLQGSLARFKGNPRVRAALSTLKREWKEMNRFLGETLGEMTHRTETPMLLVRKKAA